MLGAEVEELHYGRIALVLGDARLHVQFPTSAPNPRPVAPAGPGASDFCLVWDGAAADAAAHLERHGVAIVAGPVDRQGSARHGLVGVLPRPGRQPRRADLLRRVGVKRLPDPDRVLVEHRHQRFHHRRVEMAAGDAAQLDDRLGARPAA